MGKKKRPSPRKIIIGPATDMTDPAVRACKSKQKYALRIHAERALQRMIDRGITTAHVYACGYCNGFHIGNNDKPEVAYSIKGKVLARMKCGPVEAVLALPAGSITRDDSAMEGELIAYRRDGPLWRKPDGSPCPNWREYVELQTYWPRDTERFITLMDTYLGEHVAPVQHVEAATVGNRMDLSALSSLKGKLPELEKFQGERIFTDEKGRKFVRQPQSCLFCQEHIEMRVFLVGEAPDYRATPPFPADPKSMARIVEKGSTDWLCDDCAQLADEPPKEEPKQPAPAATEAEIEATEAELYREYGIGEKIEEIVATVSECRDIVRQIAERPAPAQLSQAERRMVRVLQGKAGDPEVESEELRGALWAVCEVLQMGRAA